MIISINKPFSINEIGKRLNNEDSTYPKNENVSVSNRLFLVCDGVGGANKGEVASSLACECIQDYFNNFLDAEKDIDAGFIEKAIRYTETRFDDYIKENPEAKGMATTLCLIFLSPNGIFLTHAGDSRIYQEREGKIIFRTEDHSLVNSWIKSGMINEEDAKTHPRKNVIYRAIQGSEHPVEVDVIQLVDIQAGDNFLMYTDGVSEAVSDSDICKILNEKGSSAETKLSVLKEICTGKARDNFSAFLIPIQDVQEAKTFKQFFLSFLYSFM